MTKKTSSKYSEYYYKKLLLRSSVLVMLLSTIFLLLFLFLTIDNHYKQSQERLNTENKTCFSALNDTLDNVKNNTLFFALYKDFSPLYSKEINFDARKIILQEDIKSLAICYDYVAGIEVTISETAISYGQISSEQDLIEVQKLKPFQILTTEKDAFPHLLVISYTAKNLDTYSTRIALHSDYLSQHIISDNSYLLMDDGTILLAKDVTLIGKHISDIVSIEMDTIKQGSHSSKYLLAKQAFSEDGGMQLVSLTPKNTVYKDIILQSFILLSAFLLVSMFGVLLLNLFLGRLYKPIKDVAQILKYYMPANDRMLDSDASFIKKCLKRYNTSENIDAALLHIRKSQLITLHSQISPHMLGNSLDAIKWKIVEKLGYNDELEYAIASLSNFLEDSYEYQQIIIPMREEVEKSKYYADMMVYCFFKKLRIEWNVMNEVLDCAIVSMSIQPFIENCINHGFTHKELDPKVLVRISTDGEFVYIEIEDNGKGMTQETLASITNSLKDDEYGHKHIGIKNVHLKLKLLYGDEYGITDIQSGDTGTYIKITIPNVDAPSNWD